jgi:hypothetical protein
VRWASCLMDLAYMYELKEEILPYFAVEENGGFFE